MSVVKASLRSLWWKEASQATTSFALFDTDKIGMGDVTLNEIPNVSPAYGRGPDGNFKIQIEITEAPSDFNTFDLMFLEDTEVEHRLLQSLRDKRPLLLQRLTYNCPPVDNRALWKTLEHFKILPSGGTLGAGPNRDGTDAAVESTGSMKVTEAVRLYRISLSRLVTTEAEAIACLAGLGQDNDCLAGYPGADQILVFGAEAGSGVVANALYSMNGGGSILDWTTDPSPFAEVDEHIISAEIGIVSDTQFRVIYFAGTEAATKAKWAYQDFPFAATVQTAASWNVITIAATSNADAVEATLWDQTIGRLYIGAAGDIYVSTDSGVSDPGTAVFTGSDAFAQFAKDEDNNMWVVAANAVILRELANNRGTFSARTGPGAGAFTAITFADDGTLFAGHVQSVYKNTDKAGSAAAWTSIKDFGSSKVVVKIETRGGSSTTIRVYVDDTTPGVAEVWESEDGGTDWRLITVSANDGYNDVLVTKNPQKAFIAGDIQGSTGNIELISNP